MMRSCLLAILSAVCCAAASADPLNLKQLRTLSQQEGDISAALQQHGFSAYGEPVRSVDYEERNYADQARNPRNVALIRASGARRHESRLTYDTYDIPEARRLQQAIERAGFRLTDEGEVARARYRLYRHRDGSEIQINLPKRRHATVGFVFYRDKAD